MTAVTLAASACLGGWGGTAEALDACLRERRPAHRQPALLAVPGFLESSFNPLVREVARRCLERVAVRPAPESGTAGAATAIVLGSVLGDTTTADLASRQLAAGQPGNALLFYQSIPNSILGFVSREFGITGPISCVASTDRLAADLLATAALTLADDGIEQVLAIGVELAANPRSELVFAQLSAAGQAVGPPAWDTAVAVLLRRAAPAAAPADRDRVTIEPPGEHPPGPPGSGPGSTAAYVLLPAPADRDSSPTAVQVSTGALDGAGSVQGLVHLCLAHEHMRRRDEPAVALVHDTTMDGRPLCVLRRHPEPAVSGAGAGTEADRQETAGEVAVSRRGTADDW
ncbi:beta-ketoacyl synthase N-terminal-like domain-containing protein [Micromonospora sp. KC721]|uniref:beta-ketoacyl synthase N-terminal-like domain-containing protein n=1 Tax=Micromonospora sp. KC721 TaxID=2530380 RepID=UPI001043EC0C|nr:beta-ketoacyl synthase N-terminal-like domain-containing protein [Micromonospora sp. KC721]TDB81874.1 hypothetical protein E1182_03510 [Micromonospora sp. KC721]